MSFRVAPLDSYAERITTGVAYLGGLLLLPLLFSYLSNLHWAGLLIPSSFAGLLALFLLLAYASQPTSYQLEEKHLVVKRRWLWAVRVPFAQITGVALAPALADLRQLRLAFNPGIFGYQGPFQLAPYGKAFFLATNRECFVSVARKTALPLILSPIQPRLFVEKLNEQRKQI